MKGKSNKLVRIVRTCSNNVRPVREGGQNGLTPAKRHSLADLGRRAFLELQARARGRRDPVAARALWHPRSHKEAVQAHFATLKKHHIDDLMMR